MRSNFSNKTELTNVKSEVKRIAIFEILRSHNPSHDQRLWLVGFLHYAGYSEGQIFEIIAKHNTWTDFDKSKTQKHISTSIKSSTKHKANHVKPPAPVRRECLYLSRFDTKLDTKLETSHGRAASLVSVGPNIAFFENAAELAVEYAPDCFSYSKLSEYDNVIYRTIEGTDHVLFVLDIDCENDLERAWRVTQRLIGAGVWDWVKFSGSKGFHLIEKHRATFTIDYAALKERAHKLCSSVDMEGIEPDWCMFHQRRLIRGFCKHWKTGLWSVPVTQNMTLKDILGAADKGLDNLPELQGGPSMVGITNVGEPIMVDLTQGRFIEVQKKTGEYGNMITISRGEYWSDGNGKSGKRYKSNVTVSDAKLPDLIKALNELQTRP